MDHPLGADSASLHEKWEVSLVAQHSRQKGAETYDKAKIRQVVPVALKPAPIQSNALSCSKICFLERRTSGGSEKTACKPRHADSPASNQYRARLGVEASGKLF